MSKPTAPWADDPPGWRCVDGSVCYCFGYCIMRPDDKADDE